MEIRKEYEEKLRQKDLEIKESVLDLIGNTPMVRLARIDKQFSKGKRPQDVSIETEGHVHTCFPTKLAFAPRLAEAIIPKLQPKTDSINTDFTNLMWPKPMVALPVWESDAIWNRPEVLCT